MTLERVKHTMERLKMQHTLGTLPELVQEAVQRQEGPLAFLDRVVTLELQAREESRIATSLRLSGLPKGMQLDTFDFAFQPSVEKARIDVLATGDFIRKKENILFLGPPGVGKTHLAVGLGVRAVELGYSVSYTTMDELIQALKRRADVPVSKQTRPAYMKNALVVVDELGYQSLDRRETHLFFQFIAARYVKGSLILTSNRSIRDWVHLFAEDELATTALLDRILHRAHIFSVDGRSYRLKDMENLLKEKR
jgi:DNA replication protein DnaC